MFKVLLFLFITIPLLEIYLLLQVGGFIGAINTIALILLTALIGTLLLRQQGLATLLRVQQTLDQGQLPAGALVEGLMLLLAGALLLTPGFVTDLIGFLCLVPALRQELANRVILWFIKHRESSQRHSSGVIEGEFWDDDGNNKNDLLP
ncbi:MAG: FxsA family protein [Thiotrichales bacterium]|nr:FxsA family protein [Thiotrichales bacterium]